MKKSLPGEEDNELDKRLGEVVLTTMKKKELQNRAQEECVLGVIFLCVLEVRAGAPSKFWCFI